MEDQTVRRKEAECAARMDKRIAAQREVELLSGEGLTKVQIAKHLGIAYSTVYNYLKNRSVLGD